MVVALDVAQESDVALSSVMCVSVSESTCIRVKLFMGRAACVLWQ